MAKGLHLLTDDEVAEIAGSGPSEEAVRDIVMELFSVTVPRAAEISGCSESTIHRAIDAGRLAHRRLGARALSVPLLALKAWLEECTYGLTG